MWPVISGGGHLNNKQAESFAEAGESLAEAEPSSNTSCLRSQSTLDYCSDGVPRWLEGLLLQHRLDWAPQLWLRKHFVSGIRVAWTDPVMVAENSKPRRTSVRSAASRAPLDCWYSFGRPFRIAVLEHTPIIPPRKFRDLPN
ncbi:hypothetical protein LA080_009902 [Diaporthe eres]|nr:hypothetical protein LA080_009902 [Diaporthe eres]